MKKTLMAIIIAITLAIAPGCSMIQRDSIKQISSIVLNGPILINDVEKVYDNLAKLQAEKEIFNADELEVFSESMSVFEIVKMEYETLIALEMLPSTEDAMVMWKQARVSYLDSMKIIESKRSEYNARTNINIDVMDAHAKRADIDITALLSNPTSANLTDALKIIGGLVKIGAKVAILI